ncbi:hypothetical protein [Streptomyces sp. NPDC014995]|uniref:hypothetical protein n=1 Tax=Streptomyces sp. NPDC014995 TaxID=3364936 RepID=UPI0036FA0D65
MPADEVTTGSDVDAARVRTGPRHAAPKKPLFTRLHMPAGKAIALAAMPTAVLMGMGFTPTLANADDQPSSKNLTIDEYKDCVAALEDEDADASASPSPSASESTGDSADEGKDDAKDGSEDGSKDEATDGSGDSGSSGGSSDGEDASGGSSPDAGSGDGAEPAPSASASAPEKSTSSSGGDTATASPSPSESDKNVLETIGDAITDLFDGTESDAAAGASPSPSASEPAGTGTGGDTSSDSGSSGSGSTGSGTDGSGSTGSGTDGSGTAKDTTDALTDAAKDTADQAGEAAEDTTEKADEAASDAADATASPSPSASETTGTEDCPVATDDESGVDNKVPLADDPWYLDASSLLLKGADYQGIVEVKTANGTRKKVLKYVISEGSDIGDLHQTVKDKQAGVTYHVQAGPGTTSTIRNGDTIMYTESISGNLFGLIPVTFSPEHPPPLNIPLIYFTKVKVVQAGQFGGDLHVPGMHVYSTK